MTTSPLILILVSTKSTACRRCCFGFGSQLLFPPLCSRTRRRRPPKQNSKMFRVNIFHQTCQTFCNRNPSYPLATRRNPIPPSSPFPVLPRKLPSSPYRFPNPPSSSSTFSSSKSGQADCITTTFEMVSSPSSSPSDPQPITTAPDLHVAFQPPPSCMP